MSPASLKVTSQQLQRNEGGGTQGRVGTTKIPMTLGDSLGKVRKWEVMGRKGSPAPLPSRIRGPKLLFQDMHCLYLKHIYMRSRRVGGHSS